MARRGLVAVAFLLAGSLGSAGLGTPPAGAGSVAVTEGTAEQVLGRHADGVTSVAFSSDGRLVVSTGRDRTVRLWDVAGRRQVWMICPCRGLTDDATFSSDGRLSLFADPWGGAARLVETVSGGQVRALQLRLFQVNHAAYAPDGRLVATGGQERTIRLWNTATGREWHQLIAHVHALAAAYTPDGRRIATGGSGIVARVDLPRPPGLERPDPTRCAPGERRPMLPARHDPLRRPRWGSEGWCRHDGTQHECQDCRWTATEIPGRGGRRGRRRRDRWHEPSLSVCPFALTSSGRRSASPLAEDGCEGLPQPGDRTPSHPGP